MFSSVLSNEGFFMILNPLHQAVFEVGFAIVIVALLAIPFVNQFQRLRELTCNGTKHIQTESKVESSRFQNYSLYPRESSNASSSSSSILMGFSSIHDEHHSQNSRIYNHGFINHFDANIESYKLPRNSSFMMETNLDLPFADIRNIDYRVCRHKLLEEVLKKYYAERQPPGQVVMNSLHLNRLDGSMNVHKEDIFGFFGKLCDSLEILKGQEQYVHPLDYFLMKSPKITSTEEKCVDTHSSSLISVSETVSDVLLVKTKNIGNPVKQSKISHIFRNQADLSTGTKSHIRPLTDGESASDLYSYINETKQDIGNHLSNNKDDKTKIPWLVSSHAVSFNRKYGKATVNDNSHAKLQKQHLSPPTTAERIVCEASSASLVSTTRIPSPMRSKTASSRSSKTNEILYKDTIMNSTIQKNRNIKMTNPSELIKKMSWIDYEEKEMSK